MPTLGCRLVPLSVSDYRNKQYFEHPGMDKHNSRESHNKFLLAKGNGNDQAKLLEGDIDLI
jgi:hypothetical protein